MSFIATFFSHFGATKFRRLCRSRGVEVELMPVPRSISSSCGTCARSDSSPLAADEPWPDEVELVVVSRDEAGTVAFSEVYRAECA